MDRKSRALADLEYVVVAGLRTVMKRDLSGTTVGNSGRRMPHLPTKEGESVPHYPYRRPPS